jgi:TrmH family RNA methyltransferase
LITSKDNEKLKLIRKLADRKHRQREGLFAAEGEDLVGAADAAGREPVFVLRAGEDVEPELLAAVSSLGSGARVIGVYRQEQGGEGHAAPCAYLHEIGDPGNVGAIIRSAHALLAAPVVLGPGCADAYSPKAVRASMGSIFATPPLHGGPELVPAPRVGLVAHGGEEPDAREVGGLCLGGERAGLPDDVLAGCDRSWTIPLHPEGAESLNVAVAAAIALGRLSSARPRAGGP